MTRKEDVAEVTVVLSLHPGGPDATVVDAARWLEAVFEEGKNRVEGYNTFRYSDLRVTGAKLLKG